MKQQLLTVIIALNLILPMLVNTAQANDELDSAAGSQESPMVLVKATTEALTSRLKSDRKQVLANPEHTITIVKDIVLPNIAIGYIAKSVLANHWQSADKQQKLAFTEEFKESLLRFYAKAFRSYDNEVISYTDEIIKGRKALVRTEIIRPGDESIPVDYKLMQKGNGEWLVVDIIVKSVSLVNSNREQYDAEVGTKGLDAVIAKLSEKNKQKF